MHHERRFCAAALFRVGPAMRWPVQGYSTGIVGRTHCLCQNPMPPVSPAPAPSLHSATRPQNIRLSNSRAIISLGVAIRAPRWFPTQDHNTAAEIVSSNRFPPLRSSAARASHFIRRCNESKFYPRDSHMSPLGVDRRRNTQVSLGRLCCERRAHMSGARQSPT